MKTEGYIQKQQPEVLYKKSVHKNILKFTGKHLCQSLFQVAASEYRQENIEKAHITFTVSSVPTLGYTVSGA